MSSNLWYCLIPAGSSKTEFSQKSKVTSDQLHDIFDLKQLVRQNHKKVEGVDDDELLVYDCNNKLCDPSIPLSEFKSSGTGTGNNPFVISYPAAPAAQGIAPSALHLVCCIQHLDGPLCMQEVIVPVCAFVCA
jgi:hypothetical protein